MTTFNPLDRRPIAVRHWALSQHMARTLANWRFSPNAISLAGLVAGIAAGVSLAATAVFPSVAYLCWLLGAGLIALRLLANMLDGMVAVESRRSSPLGMLFN